MSSRPTRRGVLRGLAGTSLRPGLGSRWLAEPTEASCGTAPVECGVNGADACLCYITTGRASFCGGTSTIVIACREDRECEAIHGAGAACVPCGPNMFCVARCPDPD